ncbi:MAG TPA: hypothetical protein PKI66_00175 [Methanobacteriaceae archaeon]|nr:hypothetical protein [Methanobacteriaceae archaeon]
MDGAGLESKKTLIGRMAGTVSLQLAVSITVGLAWDQCRSTMI